jgi:hypothetical protein
MSTATELRVDTGDISQGSPSQTSSGDATFSNSQGAISKGSPPWLDGVQDTELREFIQNKGWNDPAEMAQGYRNLEKLVGGEKLPLPKGDTDSEGWERVFKAPGMPAKPEDYQLPDLESAAAYHKLGLTGPAGHGAQCVAGHAPSGAGTEGQGRGGFTACAAVGGRPQGMGRRV